jgi:hypothetical protein
MGTDQHQIFAGVDMHKDSHHAAVLDDRGRLLAERYA